MALSLLVWGRDDANGVQGLLLPFPRWLRVDFVVPWGADTFDGTPELRYLYVTAKPVCLWGKGAGTSSSTLFPMSLPFSICCCNTLRTKDTHSHGLQGRNTLRLPPLQRPPGSPCSSITSPLTSLQQPSSPTPASG